MAEHRTALILVCIVAVYAIAVALSGGERTALLFHDDSFFYMKTANNLAHGLGSTFDGINSTNGYHPLYLLLLTGLARLRPLTGGYGVTAVFLLDMFLFGLGLLVVESLQRSYRVSAGGRILTGLALLLFVGGLFDFGLEVKLLFPLAWSYVWLLERWTPPSRLRQVWPIGLLGAVICLTRLEMWVFVLLVLLARWVLPAWARGSRRYAAGILIIGFAPAVVALAGYAVFNLHFFGHPTSVSSWLKVGFPGTFATKWILRSSRALMTRIVLSVVLAIPALVVCSRKLRRRESEGSPERGRWLLLLSLNLFVIVYVCAMLLMIRRAPASWYLALPISIVLFSAITVWECDLIPRPATAGGALRGGRSTRLAVVITVVLLLCGVGYRLRDKDYGISFATWMRDSLPGDVRVFQVDHSGFIAYFSERAVIDGGGLINGFEYQEYLSNLRLKDYLRDKGVTHLVWDEYRGEDTLAVPIYLCRPALLWTLPQAPKLIKHMGRFALYDLDEQALQASQVSLLE